MDNPLLLHTKNDIPFMGGQCSVHNPTINEIALIGEEKFQKGIRFLDFSKNNLEEKDKIHLLDKSDFEILIEIMKSKEYHNFVSLSLMVLSLLFPSYEVELKNNVIQLTHRENRSVTTINKDNYDEFKDIIENIFVLNSQDEGSGNYNPGNGLAQKIAEKLQRGRAKAAKEKGADLKNKTIYGRIVSILSVGLKKDKNALYNYTVYQLLDEYKRYQLNTAYEMNIRARMAGATDLDEPEEWMGDLLL